MPAETPQLTISRVFDAPRALVFQAFTDPDQVAAWWGPRGSVRPRDEMDFDVRPGGHERWTQVATDDPDVRVHVAIDLTTVAAGDLLEGVIRVSGRLPGAIEPYETRFRIEFHDEPDGRSRIEISHWLPADMAGPTNLGWSESFEQLDATLVRLMAAAADMEG